jgi:membrane protein YqaA with SNARE-associated domain
MGLIWIVAVSGWAVAEATLFFVVPDVLITFAVMRFGLRAGIKLCVIAAAIASVAGTGMWAWGHADPDGARHVLLMVPFIGPDLLARAHAETMAAWPLHLVTGAMTGVPYKLYAVEAGARGIDPMFFLPMSFIARIARFLLTALGAYVGRELMTRLGRPQWRYACWALAWVAVYGFYWTSRTMT